MRHALAHLTALPVGRPLRPPGPASLIAFPLVGVLVALVWIVVGRISGLLLGPAVGAGAVLLADAWLTRALHLDGLASVVDGAAGADDAEGGVALVREAAIAVPGATALLTVSLVRFGVLIIAVSPPGPLLAGTIPVAAFGLLVVPAAGRLAMVVCHALVPPREDEADGFGQPTGAVVAVAAAVTALAAVPAGGRGLAAIGAAVTTGAAVAWWWRRRFGGLVAEVPAGAGMLAETVALAALYAL